MHDVLAPRCLMCVHVCNRVRALARVHYRGETWGPVELTQELTQANCQMPIIRTRSNNIFMAHPELFLGGNFPPRQRDKGISGQNYDTAIRINGTVRKAHIDSHGALTWPSTAAYSRTITGFLPYMAVQLMKPGAWQTQFGYSSLTELAGGDGLGILFETGAEDCHSYNAAGYFNTSQCPGPKCRPGVCSGACQVRFALFPEF